MATATPANSSGIGPAYSIALRLPSMPWHRRQARQALLTCRTTITVIRFSCSLKSRPTSKPSRPSFQSHASKADWNGRLSQEEIFMAAYLIAFAKGKNANRIPEYSSAAGPTLGASGGSVVTRGKVRSLVGGFSADSCLIVKLKDAAAIQAWHDSPGYQALIPLRDDVMDSSFLVLEEPA